MAGKNKEALEREKEVCEEVLDYLRKMVRAGKSQK